MDQPKYKRVLLKISGESGLYCSKASMFVSSSSMNPFIVQ